MPTLFCIRLLALSCATLLAGCGLRAAAAPALPWKLPPADGELSGEFYGLIFGDAPRLKWSIHVRTEKPRERAVDFTITAQGFRIKGEARVDPDGEGDWRIVESQIDLGQWFAWLAPHFAPHMVATTLAGTAALEAEGTWRGGILAGRAVVSLNGATIDDPSHRVVLHGINCRLEIVDFMRWKTAPSQVLTWTNGRYDRIALGAGRIEFSVDADRVNVDRATLSIFGGELAVNGLSFSTKRPDFSVSAQVTGFQLGEFLFLLPKVFARVEGRVDGYLDVNHSATGFAFGAGYLGLREGETALLQLTPKPGLLSGFLPPMINKIYPGIAKMESEGVPMKADVLQMHFMPQRDEFNRSALLHIAGQPVDPSLTAPIDLEVNVRGPLDELINFGTNSAMRVMGRK